MKKTIMIVEDDELFSEMYRYKLEREGFEIIINNNGVDAISRLSSMEQEPDLVLLDLIMPHMNGFEVLKTVRTCEKLNRSKIIVFSVLSEARSECIELGAYDFIGKSEVTPKELTEKIKAVLS